MNTAGLWIERVRRWAPSRPDIQGLALVGSQARGTAREDSDIDLVILADEPDLYLAEAGGRSSQGWISAFGKPISISREDWGAVQSLRVFYQDGPEVEFGITSTEWASISPLDAGTKRVVTDGMRILFDRAGLLQQLLDLVG